MDFDPRIDSQEECVKKYENHSLLVAGLPHCPAQWDRLHCWPPTPSNSVAFYPCTSISLRHFGENSMRTHEQGFRVCTADAAWAQEKTNYTGCQDAFDEYLKRRANLGRIIEVISVGFSSVSLISTVCALIAFCCLKRICCDRLKIHRHLIIALMLSSICMILLSAVRPLYEEHDWLCKAITTFLIYCSLSSIFWMFIEGLFLHSRVVTNVFDARAPIRIYRLFGWLLPLAFVIPWVITTEMHFSKANKTRTFATKCWRHYYMLPYVWILLSGMTIALVANVLFLANIIRILILKMRGSALSEVQQVKKALKATLVLCPLLGTTNLVFYHYWSSGPPTAAYLITNATLQSSQGFVVSLLYCFLNAEVRAAAKQEYERWIRGMQWRRRRISRFTSFTGASLRGSIPAAPADVNVVCHRRSPPKEDLRGSPDAQLLVITVSPADDRNPASSEKVCRNEDEPAPRTNSDCSSSDARNKHADDVGISMNDIHVVPAMVEASNKFKTTAVLAESQQQEEEEEEAMIPGCDADEG